MAIGIKEEMAALDGKNRNFYRQLSDDERKKFSNFMMIRWGATVQGEKDLQEYYLLATNTRLNKYFFDISTTNHAELQWLLASTISPGIGNQHHQWIGLQKKGAGNNKMRKFLEAHFPTMKAADMDLLVSINDDNSVKQLAEEYGFTKEQIKKAL